MLESRSSLIGTALSSGQEPGPEGRSGTQREGQGRHRQYNSKQAPQHDSNLRQLVLAPQAVSAPAVFRVPEAVSTSWFRAHGLRLRLVDFLCIVLAVLGAYTTRFGNEGDVSLTGQIAVLSNPAVSVLLVGAWWVMLECMGTRDAKVFGTDVEEYRRVTGASLWLFGTMAVVSYLLQIQTARGYVAIAFPLGISLLLLSRWTQRRSLHRTRRHGENLHRVLLLGAPRSVDHLGKGLDRNIEAGYKPVAAFLTSCGPVETQLPVLGTLPTVDLILEAIKNSEADTVAITSAAELDPLLLRHLGWALSSNEIRMIMAPALTDVSGPRIHVQPVAGLPLVHVTSPRIEGVKAFAKRILDIVGSLLLLALFSVPMAVVALLVKLDSPGPALFLQERIGKDGEPFRMIKFRSMCIDAEYLLEDLQTQTQDSVIFFKLKEDPRITRLGAWLRRYSVDELPQLLNVLNGRMSLVGPRPQVAREVEQYDIASQRRLMVKPGMTGPWQVGGRNDLSLEESIRLDLYYVENWSLTQDILILFRTFRAVVGKDGAY